MESADKAKQEGAEKRIMEIELHRLRTEVKLQADRLRRREVARAIPVAASRPDEVALLKEKLHNRARGLDNALRLQDLAEQGWRRAQMKAEEEMAKRQRMEAELRRMVAMVDARPYPNFINGNPLQNMRDSGAMPMCFGIPTFASLMREDLHTRLQ